MGVQNSDLQIGALVEGSPKFGPAFCTLLGGGNFDETSLRQVVRVLVDAAIRHVTMTFHIAVHAAWYQRQLTSPSFFQCCLCFV